MVLLKLIFLPRAWCTRVPSVATCCTRWYGGGGLGTRVMGYWVSVRTIVHHRDHRPGAVVPVCQCTGTVVPVCQCTGTVVSCLSQWCHGCHSGSHGCHSGCHSGGIDDSVGGIDDSVVALTRIGDTGDPHW